jgi:hypothetical protein
MPRTKNILVFFRVHFSVVIAITFIGTPLARPMATGSIVVSGWLSLEKAKAVEKELNVGNATTLRFANCTGGTLVAMEYLAGIIRRQDINTIAEENCSSACALAFLHGREREVRGIGTMYMLLHGPSVPIGAQQESFVKRVENVLRETTQNKLPSSMIGLIINARGRDHGLVFVSENSIFGRKEYVVQCAPNQLPDIANCQALGGVSFHSIGLTTK